VKRIGHKGADLIRPGNTLESFEAAVDAGAEMIELDVLRPKAEFRDGADWRRAAAGPVPDGAPPLLVAHDWGDAAHRNPMQFEVAMDAFTRPPLDRVALDCDLKIAGREDEVVALLRERSLLDRAMVSTMEVRSLDLLRTLEPGLDRGWTLPRVDRDWNSKRWARPLVIAGSASLRARLPGQIRAGAPRLQAWAVWVYHPLITRRLVSAAHDANAAVIAWTVDEPRRIAELAALGVDGICSNDPRLLDAV
jgi:glycerophosphoryl diester phosphodiesterase